MFDEYDQDELKQMMHKLQRAQEKRDQKYRDENPCPACGSHNVDFDIMYISGPHSGWIEWCNDCGWEKRTES